MPAKSVIVQESVKKQLRIFQIPIHKRLITSLEKIKQNPMVGKKFTGELKNYYKYRVGDYRIVYSFDAKTSTVIVIKIEHRQGVYK